MSTTVQTESARIYSFPQRTRAKVEAKVAAQNSVVSLASRRAAAVVYDGGWYHDEAIRQAERDRKR